MITKNAFSIFSRPKKNSKLSNVKYLLSYPKKRPESGNLLAVA